MTKENNNNLCQEDVNKSEKEERFITWGEGTIDASNINVSKIDASNITTGYGIDVSRFVTKDVFENW